MTHSGLKGIMAVVVLLACAAAWGDGPEIVKDSKNIVAQRLAGVWKLDSELTKTLRGHAPPPMDEMVCSFKADPTVLADFDEWQRKLLAGKTVALAGTSESQSRSKGEAWRAAPHGTFVLVEQDGCTMALVWTQDGGYSDRGPDPMRVQLVPGADRKNDLLFIGPVHDVEANGSIALRRADAAPGAATQPAAGRATKARIAAAKAQIAILETALNTFEVDTGRFPTSDEGLKVLVEKPANAKDWHGPYLTKGPPNDPWDHPYVYRCPGTHNPVGFDVYSDGPSGRDGADDTIGNWKQEP